MNVMCLSEMMSLLMKQNVTYLAENTFFFGAVMMARKYGKEDTERKMEKREGRASLKYPLGHCGAEAHENM